MLFKEFDDVYCITIRNNKERQASAKSIAEALNIPLKFYYVDRHPRGGIFGCLHSHLSLIKLLYDRGSKRVLIFEDDFVPTPGYSTTVIRDVLDFTETNKDWEMLQLGYSPLKSSYDMLWPVTFPNSPKANETGTIIQHTGALTHAYCLSRKGMAHILDLSKEALSQDKLHLDMWYCKIIRHGYATVPIMFDQKWCFPTDNNAHQLIEKVIYRPLQCYAEKTQLFYRLSLLPRYRFAINLAMFSTLALTTFFIYRLNQSNDMYLRVKKRTYKNMITRT